jgi:hypothetical protein
VFTQRPDERGKVMSVLGRDLFALRSHSLDDFVLPHGSSSQKLFRSTEHRRLDAVCPTGTLDLNAHLGIRNVPQIPGQQIIHTVTGRYRDVERVGGGLGGYRASAHKILSEDKNVITDIQDRNAS